MTLNGDKFECFRYGHNNTLQDTIQYWSNTGSFIQAKSSVRDLGLNMSNTGSFNKQIQSVIFKQGKNALGFFTPSIPGKLLQCSPGGNPSYTTGLLQPVMVPITHWRHPRIRDGSENLPTKNLRSQIMELLGLAQTSEYLLSEKASWVFPNVENLLHTSLPVHRQRLFNTLPAGMCNTKVCSVDCFKRILDHTRRASDPRVYCTKMSKE